MELKLPSSAGWRPPKKKMMFLPKVSSCLRLPLRNPSPTPASSSSEPTPHAIPNIVRNDRNLCAHRVRRVCAKVSSSMRISHLRISTGRERLKKRRPAPLILRLTEVASVSAEICSRLSPVFPCAPCGKDFCPRGEELPESQRSNVYGNRTIDT